MYINVLHILRAFHCIKLVLRNVYAIYSHVKYSGTSIQSELRISFSTFENITNQHKQAVTQPACTLNLFVYITSPKDKLHVLYHTSIILLLLCYYYYSYDVDLLVC